MIYKRSLEEIKMVVIHCSDSEYGDLGEVEQWHLARGFDKVGYHYVITNGVINNIPPNPYIDDDDGIIQMGRKLDEIGAHAKGHNAESIGICLIGKYHFTSNQIKIAVGLSVLCCLSLGISELDICGHYELQPEKTCPNIDMNWFRGLVSAGIDSHNPTNFTCRI